MPARKATADTRAHIDASAGIVAPSIALAAILDTHHNPTTMTKMNDYLSEKQQEALAALRTHGRLIRRPGGYWTYPDCPKNVAYPGQPEHSQAWAWWTGTRTIQALIEKGKAFQITKKEVRPTLHMAGGNADGS